MMLARMLVLIASASTLAVSEPLFAESGEAEAVDPQNFAERMAGEWTLTVEAILEPGQEPRRAEGRAHARWLGGRWLVAESSGEAGGLEFTWIFTLGYIRHADEFVATWVDSRQSHLWTYSGSLDKAGDVITLEAKGPIMGDPNTLGDFRTTVEIIDDDHWIMRSLILGPGGEWFEFTRIDFRRA